MLALSKVFLLPVSDSLSSLSLLFSYPDATAEELSTGDNVCIICREEMSTQAKKLPCNHIFHITCLRSWFQRQQTCPTCRMDVLQPQPQPAANAMPAQPPGHYPVEIYRKFLFAVHISHHVFQCMAVFRQLATVR